MEKTFILKGLDCPHCAAKIERDVKALDGVASAQLNLMKQTLTVNFFPNAGKIGKHIENIVHGYEPDVIVTEAGTEKDRHVKKDKRRIPQLILGGILFAAGLLMDKFGLILLIISYIILGGDVLLRALKNIIKGRLFDENFLMSLSTVGAFVIGEYPEAVAVMLFYQIGEFFQDMAVDRSRKSIADLMDIRPDSATVRREGDWVSVSPETVAVGEQILVKPGERIPLDGIVVEGQSMLDTKALTGESVPRPVVPGDTALSGCIDLDGALIIEVTKPYGESTAAKIIDLVENAAGRKAPTENFITTFARYYTPIVVILAAMLAIVPPLIWGSWVEWIRRAFVFLVISCPCALVISVPLAFFGGIGAASRHGVLVKGSNYLEALNSVRTVVFDKTGTLTKGVFRVTKILAAESFSDSQVLEYAAQAEYFSNHPIAKSILSAYGKEIDETTLSGYQEFPGRGISVTADGKWILAGNGKMMESRGIRYMVCDQPGSKVYITVDGRFAGCIVISDEIKADSRSAIKKLKALGIDKTVMLTGDDEAIAGAVAKNLGIDEYYAQLLPDQKLEKLEALGSSKSEKLAFVGDGINDAPVLARADVGIAMGALGSDAAIEAADVVLMTDEPSKLVDAMAVARATKRIVVQNIVFALGVKLAFLALGAFGIAGMWEAVFADVGVALLAVLNSLRMLRFRV